MPAMKTPRVNFQLVAANGELFALGGRTKEIHPTGMEVNGIISTTSKCEKFSFVDYKWTDIQPLKQPNSYFAAVHVDGQIVVSATRSETAEWYDLESKTWTSQLCMPGTIGWPVIFLPGINIHCPEMGAPQIEQIPDGVKITNAPTPSA